MAKAKKFGVYAIFGEGATDELEENGSIKMTPDNGSVELHEFDTKKERDAFIKGTEAASGWLESMVVLKENAKVSNGVLKQL